MTEKKLIESQELARKLFSSLEKLGVKICLDHFGRLYSSLSYLSQFPIHELKLDPSLITNIYLRENENRQILKAMSRLSHSLNIRLLAEGVETTYQAMTLNRCGYDRAQGSYFSQP